MSYARILNKVTIAHPSTKDCTTKPTDREYINSFMLIFRDEDLLNQDIGRRDGRYKLLAILLYYEDGRLVPSLFCKQVHSKCSQDIGALSN